MGRGKQRPKKKKIEKKVKDPEDKIKWRPWLRPEPAYFVTRFMWDAMKPKFTKQKQELVLPVGHVVVNYHSRLPPCTREVQCRHVIQIMQRYQCELLAYQDLAYNWYIGGDGKVYEGRGWKQQPKPQHELSAECIEIAFMGDFPHTYDPPKHMVDLLKEVVNYGIKKEYIKEDYQLHEFRQSVQPLKPSA